MRILKHLTIVSLLALIGATAHANEFKAGDLVLQSLWSRATPKGAARAAGYLTIENRGKAADRLIGGTSAAANAIEVHGTTMSDGVMRMRPIAGGLTVEPGKSATLAPNGYHIMFVGLKAPLKQGDKVKATLEFEKAGKVKVEFDVEAIGAAMPGMSGMGGHKM